MGFAKEDTVFSSTVVAGALVSCFEGLMVLAEADDLLLAMGDTMFASVDGGRDSPSIILKRCRPVHCMAGWMKSPPPVLASVMAVDRRKT